MGIRERREGCVKVCYMGCVETGCGGIGGELRDCMRVPRDVSVGLNYYYFFFTVTRHYTCACNRKYMYIFFNS